MKKEYIMSEEDKELKRMKIEQNRSKRKIKTVHNSKESSSSCVDEDVKPMKASKIKEEEEQWSPVSASAATSPTSLVQSDTNGDSDDESASERLKISADSAVKEIVSAITSEPNEASQIIQQVMRTQNDTLSVMSRIIQEPSQALLFISHLIKNPSDGMLIISKIMSQSPLDALSVFTQFMSSPIDALQIIFKVMSSPMDVMKFMTELTKSPQNALEIMNKFMATPRETMHNISNLISDKSPSNRRAENEVIIKSMLDVSSTEASPSSSSTPIPSSSSSPQNENSPSSSYQDPDSNHNNNDYQQLTSTILREIAFDITGKQPSSSSKGNSIDSIINEAIKLEYNTPQMFAQMQNATRELNEIEMMKIQELIDSNRALYEPLDEDQISFLGPFDFSALKFDGGRLFDPILMKVINLTAVAIRRLIKMSKKISGFKKMCQEDQIALLKVKKIIISEKIIKKCILNIYLGRLH